MLPECERLGLAFLPYFPLASGLLTGKYVAGAPARRIAPQSKLGRVALLERRQAGHGRSARGVGSCPRPHDPGARRILARIAPNSRVGHRRSDVAGAGSRQCHRCRLAPDRSGSNRDRHHRPKSLISTADATKMPSMRSTPLSRLGNSLWHRRRRGTRVGVEVGRTAGRMHTSLRDATRAFALTMMAAAVAWGGASLSAQHETAADIEDGGRVSQQHLRQLSWAGRRPGRRHRSRPGSVPASDVRRGSQPDHQNRHPGHAHAGQQFLGRTIGSSRRVSAIDRRVETKRVGKRRRCARPGTVRGKRRVRDVPSREWQRLAIGARSDQRRSAAQSRGTGNIAPRPGCRSPRHQPLLPRHDQRRRDDDRPAAESGYLQRAAARFEGNS